MCNNEYRIRIDGLPKNFSVHKLTKILNRHSKAWELEDLLPLEDYIIANIHCETKESYECFLKLPDVTPFSTFPDIRVYDASLIPNYIEQLNPDYAAYNSIFKLNSDCLRLVFEKCRLRDKLKIAKVCRRFHKVITDILGKTFDALFFYHSHFMKAWELNDEQTWELCILCGPAVRTLEFTTLFSLEYAKTVIHSLTVNFMHHAKTQINIWMCRHLVHFPHVQRFEVLGFYFEDFTARELARYCPQLREFVILDINSRFVLGKNFHLLKNLEVLEIPVCMNLRQYYMAKACNVLKLQELIIVENRRLMEAPFLRLLLNLQFTTLRKIWLTAISDQTVISAILELPHLENLKFYWIDKYVSFEKVLFKELTRKRPDSLYALCWDSEPPFIVNESFVEWEPGEYEEKREKAAINGCPWECFAHYSEWINLLLCCTAIETMRFHYSRILTNEQILSLPRMCKKLESIHIHGCRDQLDEALLKDWKEQTRPSCELKIEGLDWQEVKQLKDADLMARNERKPLYRSIYCRFK